MRVWYKHRKDACLVPIGAIIKIKDTKFFGLVNNKEPAFYKYIGNENDRNNYDFKLRNLHTGEVLSIRYHISTNIDYYQIEDYTNIYHVYTGQKKRQKLRNFYSKCKKDRNTMKYIKQGYILPLDFDGELRYFIVAFNKSMPATQHTGNLPQNMQQVGLQDLETGYQGLVYMSSDRRVEYFYSCRLN